MQFVPGHGADIGVPFPDAGYGELVRVATGAVENVFGEVEPHTVEPLWDGVRRSRSIDNLIASLENLP